jgi:hypothetical protein
MSNKELTEKEYAEKKEKLNNFYTKEIKYLSIQLQYEELQRDIAKARAERLQADAFVMNMTSKDTESNGSE